MDSSGGDDQGSGWMQVKKKHRSNSKFSLHGGAAKLSGKHSSGNPSNIPSPGHKFENSLNESQPSNASGDSSVPEIHNASNTTSISAEKVVADDYIPKSVVSKYGTLDSCHLSATDTASSYKLSFDPLHSDKSNILPKIKWGDLDEGTLMHYEEISGTEVNFGEVKNHNEHKEFGEAVNEDQSLPMSPMSQCVSPKIISMEEICKEVNEVPSEDVKEQITIEQVVSETDFDEEHDCLKPENDDSFDTSKENIVHETIEDEGMRITVNFKSNSGHYISEVPITVSASSTGPTLPETIEFGIVSDSASTASNEESMDRKKEANSNNFLDTQNADATNAEDMDESKERFRERLWCFLFENLNRAVDELYLLCELECDLDQMKEASLVLEEAASDFRELKSRVEKFEKMKRSHEIEGSPLIMQSDHRRPHALSWEVRRMTTSPRRADILSSSLEAFRKIQQERSGIRAKNDMGSDYHYHHIKSSDIVSRSKESTLKTRTLTGMLDASDGSTKERRHVVSGKSGSVASKLPIKEGSEICTNAKSNRELHGSTSEAEKLLNKKAKMLSGHYREKNSKSVDSVRRHVPVPEREREKKIGNSGMDAWKEKRNWEDILASPHRVSSRFSYSPGFGRKSAERVRVLHDKLMSPEKKKKSGVDLRKEAEEKHARATRIRAQLENERVQKLQRTSEKQNRVNEWQTVRSNKLRESIFDRHQRSESRHEAFLAQVVRRAGDESSKVNEVRFITSLNEENKKHILRKKLQDSEVRRAEKLQVIKTKQKEDMAREEAVLERKRLIEAEKLQRLAETQRKKEEAQVRWEEERKASNAAREAKALEKMRKKEIRAKARKEEAELLAQKLAERLSESEQRRKFYLEQIREKASMDFRDQSSPFLRRIASKEVQAQGNVGDLANSSSSMAGSGSSISESRQHLLKRRIKKIRQRLMSLKHEFLEPAVGLECSSIGYRTAVGTTRGKIGRWIQDLQKLRQARKEGAANFGLITAEMIKFVEGRDAELHASRQAGLLDFIASALPASHTCKPEACRVTIYLLRLLKIVLAMPANRCYFLVQNLLPPIIPMLAAALENYIKMAASSSSIGQTTSVSSKTAIGNLESVSEIVDGFLWIVAAIIGYGTYNENQLQMQDGLAELVIAYQIIQRLRDLFALYDRPQVEGSPFPSSILLSINLLVVLTSKFRESSSIDWESFPREVIHGNKLEWINLPERENVPECTSLNESSTIEGADALILFGKKSDDVELVASKVKTSDVMDESSRAPTDDKCENFSFQKNGSNSASNGAEKIDGDGLNLKHPAKFLLSAMAETGLVCLPSMLTAVLLQANNRLSAEQGSYALPSNFEEVATGVLKVLNNLALVDVTFIQKMLARPDLKMEFFHLLSFLLSHCTSNWGVANDKIGLLLLESLSLLGYFALFHSGNQAVLRWGKSPTILHKVCDLPFVFFSDPELMPVLASTLVAASYGCEQNKAVIQQELSMDMLIPSLKSCKTTISIQNGPSAEDSGESNQTSLDFKKLQADASQKLNRNSVKPTRVVPQKGGVLGNNVRAMKMRNQRDIKLLKACEEMHLGPGQSDASILMLHCRFPGSFIDKAEQFFAAEMNTSNGEFI